MGENRFFRGEVVRRGSEGTANAEFKQWIERETYEAAQMEGVRSRTKLGLKSVFF